MNFVNQINHFLASTISVLNALLAVFLLLLSMAAGYQAIGGLGLFIGIFAGAALAIAFCGLLALLINIRDLLSASLKQQS